MIVPALSQQALKNSTRKTRANWMFIWEYYSKEQVGRNESRLILCAHAWICNFKVWNFHGEWREKNFFINSSLHLTRAAQWVLVLTLPCWMYTSTEPFFLTLILWIRELIEKKKKMYMTWTWGTVPFIAQSGQGIGCSLFTTAVV